MNVPAFKPISAWFPIAMSVMAITVVLFHLAMFGAAPQADEGASVHIWQLLIVGQIPILIIYAVQWLPRTPKAALLVLGVQVAAAAAAIAPIFLLHW